MGLRIGVAALILGGLAPAQDDRGLGEEERILHLLNRFTPGATADLVAEVRRQGWGAWFDQQLKGDRPEPDELTSRLKRFETLSLSADEIFEKYEERIPKDATPKEKAEIRRRAAIPTAEMLAWVMMRSVYSANPVREVSCDFFRNHFTVSLDKGLVRYLAFDWERDVIYDHALGRFGDLLEATAKHPAMLFYLDNCLSRRPPTPEELKQIESQVLRKTGSEERAEEAADIAKQRGLNENYGRELLELHTLGVDHYYTQDDVISAAKCLTGWTIKRRGQKRAEFSFDPRMHCPGDKLFLGTAIKENKSNPVAEGEQLLSILKKHEGTAHFIAWKLCRWLVSDEPDEEMVQRIAKVFQKSDGDLPQVLRAIVDDPKFFSRENYRSKFKRPFEFVMSALRVTRADVTGGFGINAALSSMNEPLYRCADPTGFYDQAEAWRDPGAMAFRWTFASDLAAGRIGGAKVPASFYGDLPADQPKEWKGILVRKILPVAGLGEKTSANLDRLIEAQLAKNPKATPAQLGPTIVAALLGSPEFQKQ